MPLVGFRLVGYPPQGGWLACCPIRRCPAQVSCAGCVLPSRPSPCTWLSHAPSTRLDKTPHTASGGLSLSQYFSACLSSVPRHCLGSGIVPCPGFPFRAASAVDHLRHVPRPGADGASQVLRRLSSCMPRPVDSGGPSHPRHPGCSRVAFGSVKTLGVRHKLVEAVPALQGARSPLRPTGCAVDASPSLFAVVTTTPPWTQDSIRVGG